LNVSGQKSLQFDFTTLGPICVCAFTWT